MSNSERLPKPFDLDTTLEVANQLNLPSRDNSNLGQAIRKRTKPRRDIQMSFKASRETAQDFYDLAASMGVSLVETFERAVFSLKEKESKQKES